MLAWLILPFLSGCLTSGTPESVSWLLEYQGEAVSAKKAEYGVARVSQVLVRAPYHIENFVVLRADGSIAFDPYNVHAEAPAQLLRGVVYDAMAASGLFAAVLPSASVAAAEMAVEVQVQRLALDCRADDPEQRTAVAELLVRMVDAKGAVVGGAQASGSSVVKGRNFGAAFSAAVSSALNKAFGQLR